MTDQPPSRYNHPAYGRLRAQVQQLLQPAMEPVRAAALAQAVKAYARSIDAKADVFSFHPAV